MTPTLTLTPEAWEDLKEHCVHAYPNEGCGLLVGRLADQTLAKKTAEKVIPLENILLREGRGRFDFAFSPEEFVFHQTSAPAAVFDVVGIFHSHPDHPPRPSKTDESQPMLSGWVNVIASVHGGKFKEAKAWWREDDGRPFIETGLFA